MLSSELKSLLNSKSSNISLVLSKLFTSSFKSSILNSIGTSVIIVANFFERIPSSLFCSIFSFNLPFNSDVFFNSSSIEPNCFINFLAVLSPTPGRPGILSTESPFIAKKSIICDVFETSNFSKTSLIPQVS